VIDAEIKNLVDTAYQQLHAIAEQCKTDERRWSVLLAEVQSGCRHANTTKAGGVYTCKTCRKVSYSPTMMLLGDVHD
jgi:hypothetical protein